MCTPWRIKIPLKVKKLWYLKQGVVLTKDNLAKRKWKGCSKCSFCDVNETIQHLFLECHMARMVWGLASITFGFCPPSSVAHLFGSWLNSFPSKMSNLVLIGAVALCWALWLCRNDVVFNNRSKLISCLQVIFRETCWIRTWSLLSKEEERCILKVGCRSLEITSLELGSKAGWNALRPHSFPRDQFRSEWINTTRKS
jgi:hypothetical protein